MFTEIYYNSMEEGSVCPFCGAPLSIDIDNRQEIKFPNDDVQSTTVYRCLCEKCTHICFVQVTTESRSDCYYYSSKMVVNEQDWVDHQRLYYGMNLNSEDFFLQDISFQEDRLWQVAKVNPRILDRPLAIAGVIVKPNNTTPYQVKTREKRCWQTF